MFSPHFSTFICTTCDNNKFSICISNDNNVYSFGYSKYQSHGHKEKIINFPKQIYNLHDIKMITCGYMHTLCLTYTGDVFSFGNNNKGQLGIGKYKYELEQTNIPQKINIPPCKQVSCGNNFTICLSEDSKLYSFGFNYFGQLGLGNNNENYNSPQLIPNLNNIEFIICGGFHVLCKTYNNEYYSWGYNYYGELGQGNNDNCNKPIQCFNWPNNIIDIKCGKYHSLLLTLEGQVYSFGYNREGQLGINNIYTLKIITPTSIKDIPEIQRIECGDSHTICIDINNNLWLFGKNTSEKLGLGDTEDYKPIKHPSLSNIIDISSGGDHTFVKTIDNKIYAFGNNEYSQLGIKTSKIYQKTPIQVFIDKEDIWYSRIGKSRAKSARK